VSENGGTQLLLVMLTPAAIQSPPGSLQFILVRVT
jgi:hypothetical protein